MRALHNFTLLTAVAAIVLAVQFGASAADQIVKYQLYKVVFSDGSQATGTFDYDFTNDSANNVLITAGNGFFDNSLTATTEGSTSGISGVYETSATFDNLVLTFSSTLDPVTGALISTAPSASSLTIDATASTPGPIITLAVVSGAVLPINSLPQTSAALSGVHNANGWFKGPVTVTLTAKSGARPVATAYYSVDGGVQTLYGTPFIVPGEALHSVSFWSRDSAGFDESPKSISFGIDATPPVTSAYQTGETITLMSTDSLSGVSASYYTVNGSTVHTYAPSIVVPVGPNKVTFWSKDIAGNTEAAQTLSFTTGDTLPPTVPGSPHFTKRTATSATIVWTKSTDNVGVTGYNIGYYFSRSGRGGGSGWRYVGTTTGTQITITGTYSSYRLAVQAYDAAGNRSSFATAN